MLLLRVAGRLDLPGDREPGVGAHGGVHLVAIEAAALAGRDRGPMPPRRVRVGVALTGLAVRQGSSLFKWVT